jgi:hypothetical protein
MGMRMADYVFNFFPHRKKKPKKPRRARFALPKIDGVNEVVTIPAGKTNASVGIILSDAEGDMAWQPGGGSVSVPEGAPAQAALDDTTGTVVVSRLGDAGGTFTVTYTRAAQLLTATMEITVEANVIPPRVPIAARFDEANAVIT